jgi:RNA polymerase sigma factor (TIGR02999 family)
MDRLAPLVYAELRRIAHRQLLAEPAGHTLSTTGLAHEAYLRLLEQTRAQWNDRNHFFACAAQAMRRILVDYARRHRAARRGGPDRKAIPIHELDVSDPALTANALSTAQRADRLVALDEALERLGELSPRLARVVECRFFGGLSEKETAEVLGISQRTAAREWMTARAWLYQELHDDVA